MQQFWQQDRLTLSLQLFGILLMMFVVVALVRSIAKNLQGPTFRLSDSLKSPRALAIFKSSRILLSLLGIATLIVTCLPGFMPFSDRVDPSLGMGGIVLFFLWPIILVQVIIGFLPIETKLEPELAWCVLIACFVIGLSICKTTVSLLYN